ncbi:MAG: phosphotransferase [Pseudomonadota bacterium]
MTGQSAVRSALPLWNLAPDAEISLINVSENHTYLVEGQGQRFILRCHRPGYQSAAAIRSELGWLAALAENRALAPVALPVPIAGRDGLVLQTHAGQHMVLFEHLPGEEPSGDAAPTPLFARLGQIAARLHLQARHWSQPNGFTRPHWDLSAVFGATAAWGDWRSAPGVDHQILPLLAQAQALTTDRLTQFGKDATRYGLIHADMRLANLLQDGSELALIDFDDCGFGWWLYDFAAAVSFMETRDDLDDLAQAWIAGYREIAALSDQDAAEIDTFVMLRRMALLAWIGSHSEAPEPQALAPHFADGTAELAERFMSKFA